MTERLFDAPEYTSLVVDNALKFPRILIFIVVATILAFAWHLRERSENRLIDPISDGLPADDSLLVEGV